MMTDIEKGILRMKQAGSMTASIAKHLRISEQEVEQIWARIQEQEKAQRQNGTVEMAAAFGLLAHQYQLLGESLKEFGFSIGKTVSLEELESKMIPNDPAASAKAILRSFTVLQPFQPSDPVESLQRTLREN